MGPDGVREEGAEADKETVEEREMGMGLPLRREFSACAQRLHSHAAHAHTGLSICLNTDSACAAVGPWDWLGDAGNANTVHSSKTQYVNTQTTCFFSVFV